NEEKDKKGRLKEMLLSEDLTAKKKAISDERRKLDQAKSGINAQLKSITNLKKPLEAEKSSYLKKIGFLKDSYGQLSKKEVEAESEKKIIEEKEAASSNDEEKKKLEQERWKAEEKRRDVEKKRWTIEENINLLEAKIQEFDLKYWPVKEKEDNFRNQLAGFAKNEENLKAKIREVGMKEDFRKAEETKRLVERKITQMESRAEELNKKLETALKNEKYIEDEEKLIEEKEKTAVDIKQRKETEEKRWLIEKQRRDVERNRWGLEAERKTVEFDLASAHKIADNVRAKSESIFSELLKSQPLVQEEIKPKYEKKIEIKTAPVKKIIVEEIKPEIKKEISQKPVVKEIKVEVTKEMPKIEKPKTDFLKEEIILPEVKPIRQNGMVNGQKTEDDKKLIEEARKKIEQLKRQEMIEEDAGVEITSPITQYDLKKEAASFNQPKPVEINSEIKQVQPKSQDWSSIQSQLKPQPQTPYVPPPAVSNKPMQPSAQVIAKPLEPKVSPLTSNILASHPLPKRSGLGKKIFARTLTVILIAVLLFLNVTFWYWYIFVRPGNKPPAVVATSPIPTPECIADKDCPSGKICTQDGKCGDKPIVIIGPIFPIAETKEYKISSFSDIPGIILNVISEWPNEQDFAVDKFRRIVIISEGERRQVTIKEIFDALLITAPSGFYERLGENYTLFEYSQKEGIRVGLVSSIIDKETFAKLMTQNEGTMKNDYRSFFSLMNLESPLTTKAFASASKVKGYTGVDFR
ncbi:MAG: hypothetical protein NT148_00885, partial [Candidatus Nealsonbacteria bacterium]|nr:hypothetical protein [Candidatus Nealsonbacteria bacterium]